MTSAWSQLEQMLTCAICLDKFKNPRLLPCQHSFCGDACMEGLVDYARRQIKCPECRAEHRIPYQGVSSLPSNVTLIRFLELHARITGEEPEPVPTFMEKCSVCGEKVDGVQRCAHCEKKVCPECKEAHVDLLRREINRVNGQSKRCLSKMQEFKEILVKSEERLQVNHKSVKRDIEESCRRLIDDLQAKQKRLLEEVDSFTQAEQKTIDKLKVAINDELQILEANSQLADEKLINAKFPWTDQELSELKEIYIKAMEFVRLFDPEIGDFNRKMRFTLIPEFETLRRRICELGELKFSESASSLIASSFQYCNATGAVAMELCQTAAAQAAAQAAVASGATGYGLSQSSSNTNLGGGASAMLELPSMQNALMRSQSDHRLASQFQQRLKQQQQDAAMAAAKNGGYGGGPGGMAGSRRAGASDYETDSLRSRYAPPRSSAGAKSDYGNDLLRDWPRPGDNDDLTFGSSIQFKSAFMRRKEKERQQLGYTSSYQAADDDDDLTSEASYGGGAGGGRNVRFYDGGGALGDPSAVAKQQVRLFDGKEVEKGPLSGVPKLEESSHFHLRLHQMGAKAVVDKRLAEEEGKRDKDLVESARQAMNKAAKSASQRQASEDEIEKQKRANKQQQQVAPADSGASAESTPISRQLESPRHSPTPTAELNSSASTVVEMEAGRSQSSAAQPSTPPSPAVAAGGRRSLYGQAVNEKSRRQLSSAIQDAASYTTRRRNTNSSQDGEFTPTETGGPPSTPSSPSTSISTGTTTTTRPKRTLRSSGRSLSRQDSMDGSTSSGTTRRRRTLARGDSSLQRQQSVDSSPSTAASNQQSETHSKNFATGSGGHGATENNMNTSNDTATASSRFSREEEPLTAGRRSGSAQRSSYFGRSQTATTDQTSTTTDEETENREDDLREKRTLTTPSRDARSVTSPYKSSRYSATGRSTATVSDDEDDDEDEDNEEEEAEEDNDTDDDGSGRNSRTRPAKRNAANRASRELLPNAVNKLLDRSAQIRRDSQEQRSRGDSPQRATPTSRSRDYTSSPSGQSSYYPTSGRTSGYSGPSSTSGAGLSSAVRQRLAYQRSQSNRDSQHEDETTNSNNSIYTTASSSSHAGRRSSIDEDSSTTAASGRRQSGNSSDRTITYDTASASRPSYRRDSSGDTPSASSGGYQSRFLSRSRTSAALSSGASSLRSQDDNPSATASSSTTDRSYLSSRDRFMQSAAAALSSSPGTGSSAGVAGSGVGGRGDSTNLYAGSRSGSTSAGKFTNLLAWRSMLRARFNSNHPSH